MEEILTAEISGENNYKCDKPGISTLGDTHVAKRLVISTKKGWVVFPLEDIISIQSISQSNPLEDRHPKFRVTYYDYPRISLPRLCLGLGVWHDFPSHVFF